MIILCVNLCLKWLYAENIVSCFTELHNCVQIAVLVGAHDFVHVKFRN